MSLAVRTASWQEPKASDIETRIRVERVLAMARVFFAMVTLLAIYIDPAELSADRSAAYGAAHRLRLIQRDHHNHCPTRPRLLAHRLVSASTSSMCSSPLR